MLSLRKTMCMLLVCLATYSASFAQQTTAAKTRVFDNQPASITIPENLLQSFFNLGQNQEAAVNFSTQFNFPFKVLSNQVVYSNLQTVIVKSSAFGNSIFQVSKVINADRTISYEGRIMNEKAFDGYVLKKAEGGNYQLQKFETETILDECKL